jgi:hypothetical protein
MKRMDEKWSSLNQLERKSERILKDNENRRSKTKKREASLNHPETGRRKEKEGKKQTFLNHFGGRRRAAEGDIPKAPWQSRGTGGTGNTPSGTLTIRRDQKRKKKRRSRHF